MYPNWKISQNEINFGHCDDIQNNCDRCGKLYRYNWRKRRTREKTCNVCANENHCNVVVNIRKEVNEDTEIMDFKGKLIDDNIYGEKRAWDVPLAFFQNKYNKEKFNPVLQEPSKKTFGLQVFTDQLFQEMKFEFGEELRYPLKPLRTEFDWPSTSQLSKVDCLRAFNIMKQILLKEMSKCDEITSSDPLIARKKFYLERRFQSLEREKIRRLKIYESIYIQEEAKGGLQSLT